MSSPRSKEFFKRAQQFIPGGVNSPVRAFNSVGGDPVFISHGKGPFIHDVDGKRYIDYVGSWGPLILGHAPDAVVEAITSAAKQGTSFGAANMKGVELAARVVEAVPSVERVRFVNSGTEATMTALRLARGFTKRDRVIKFAGCYHGHADAFLSDAGSGVATLGIPGSAGVPEGAAKDTITVQYNDLDAVDSAMREVGGDVAAIILEPIACNMGMVQPAEGFLGGLRKLCDEHGALLIFDEVITGFRLGLGGAQEHFGVKPDLSTFGKVIGGGLPVGAYGGRADIMEHIAPTGPVYQAGTLSGNPLAMAAGIATLDALAQTSAYDQLAKKTDLLEMRLLEVLDRLDRPAYLSRAGSIFHLWFKPGQTGGPKNYDDVKGADSERFAAFFRSLLEQGVYIAPSAFEVGFVSTAHEDQHIEATVTAIERALEA